MLENTIRTKTRTINSDYNRQVNQDTIDAIREGKEIAKNPRSHKKFSSVEDLFNYLNS